ncbi:hypothetical protein D9611_006090 [Ephemerocybe angulata]|uniref:Mannose-6-phosphate isomerase n=1 Tax=Ephemerocybe angulata TaxID=980116 RepID=A0A8H5CHR2_9AGAR|nr:hypothetical protein D9611_006090 [Tulosesus angulatus]
MAAPSASPRVFKVIPTIQQYDWGKVGREAKVAQFAEASQLPGFSVDEGAPYAELWMGTHSSSPSVVKDSGDLLSDHLREHQDLIGSQIIDKFEDAKNGNLPFLFKVLSIAKALSIQSHPDKETAKQLHAISPKIYKDPNHKPEMALALTDFEALCGFRPVNDIARNLRDTPELESIIPATILHDFYQLETQDTPKEKVALKNLFAAVMTTPTEKVHSAVEAIVQRYQREQIPTRSSTPLSSASTPIPTRHRHPAIFLGAGEPHAYISGEAIECMANSDNVIRAGLTPKLRDVPNLVLGLTYETGEGTRHHVSPDAFSTEEQEGAQSLLYDPPIEEFSVLRLDIPKGTSAAQRAVAGPSLAIVTAGEGTLAGDDERGLQKREIS